ncbi:hypothetical protein J4E06_03875 [Muricauda sp. NFXS6]|uniref:hypothetical protein n=1 Tax=Allomuricauda sp. NFXS6 TaxID=2819094 RepID=UPI0032DF2114
MQLISKFTLLFIPLLCLSQTEEMSDFESEVLSMDIVQREKVTDYDIALAKASLESTQRATKGKVENFNALDYWNIAIALYRLKESEEGIILALKKMIQQEKGCEWLDELKYDSSLYLHLQETYDDLLEECGPLNVQKNSFDIKTYITQNNLDKDLTQLMAELEIKDQSVRIPGVSDEKLIEVSHQNIKVIDSIYQNHNKYIGRSVVGGKFASVMWLMIQHSDIETMKRYLPVILDAVKKEELKPTPARMLVDRIYGVEYGYQIYGSQPGVKIAPENIRQETMDKLGIH